MNEPADMSEERRHAIFLALMDAQELHEFTSAQARHLIAGRSGVSEELLALIEDEGREKLW